MKFFNTLTHQKENFEPITPKKVKMYCCGITPYSNMHLGHMRTFFTYDLLHRILVDQEFEIEWARNITDVDDKIMAKANSEKKSCSEITDRYIEEQNQFLKIFNLEPPLFEPRVTDSIKPIVDMIQKLINKEYAYVSTSGVYFRVRKFQEYGKLSGNKIDDLKKGARIEVDENKEDALDFALWKFVKPGEIFWESPWGNGRPGWHIECSAMIHSLFGDSIDIHMGGRDLIFPHHEAEIAQSEACTGCHLAKYWLHCGMVTLYNEKMSKSTNHYVSIEEFLKKYPAEVLRLLFLSSAYAQPLDFTFELIAENLKKLSRIYRFIALVDGYANVSSCNSPTSSYGLTPESKDVRENRSTPIFSGLLNLVQTMRDHLAQDMNSSMALAEFFEFMRTVNAGILQLEKNGAVLSQEDQTILQTHWHSFKDWMRTTLALCTQTSEEFFEGLKKYSCNPEFSESEILKKIEERRQLRENKNWQASDAIRAELLTHGVQIMDTPRGTKWFLQ